MCFAVNRLRQKWLSFSSQLTVEEVEALLKEIGLNTCQQKRQQQRLLLVQHADKALSRHVEIEVPGLLLAVFLLARADPAVLEVCYTLIIREFRSPCPSVNGVRSDMSPGTYMHMHTSLNLRIVCMLLLFRR